MTEQMASCGMCGSTLNDKGKCTNPMCPADKTPPTVIDGVEVESGPLLVLVPNTGEQVGVYRYDGIK